MLRVALCYCLRAFQKLLKVKISYSYSESCIPTAHGGFFASASGHTEVQTGEGFNTFVIFDALGEHNMRHALQLCVHLRARVE